MTIPRKDTVGIKPTTKKTGDLARFHKLFYGNSTLASEARKRNRR